MIIVEIVKPEWIHPWHGEFQDLKGETLNTRIMEAVKNGQRPRIEPEGEDFQQIYEIMKNCWDQNADLRPTAVSIATSLVKQVYLHDAFNCTLCVTRHSTYLI